MPRPVPRQAQTPARRQSAENNRVGISQASLAAMGQVLAGTQGGTPADRRASTMSYVAKRRQKLDRFIDRCDDSARAAGSSNDLVAMMLMMNDRVAARQADRDERERQFQLEQARREYEREERRAAREARQREMQMMMFARIFGCKPLNASANE